MPDDIRKVTVVAEGADMKLALLLKQAGLAASSSAAYRLLEQGAVRIDGVKDRRP